jgi:hypothetical protein
VDVLPWDKSLCRHRPGVRCSGKIGCRAALSELQPWNDSLGKRWNWMTTYIRRKLPGVTVEFFKAVEPQRRGALHLHVMFRVDDSVCPELFAAVMREVAERWGFGPQTDIQTVMLADEREVARRAGYCSKYASKMADADRRFVNPATGEIVSLRCRAWSKSGNWGGGVTMRSIEVGRRLWAASAGARQGAVLAPVALLDLNSVCYTNGAIGAAVMVNPVEIATV